MDTNKKESMAIKLLNDDHSNNKCEHHHPHDHHHIQHKHTRHHHDTQTITEKAKRKLIIVCCVCCTFMLVEFFGGLLSDSLAIMTDAAHLMSDLTGFVLSIYALSIAKRPPDNVYTFGYHRAEIVGAISSVFIIWILTALLLAESIERMMDSHHQIDGKIMLITSSIGLVFNGVMAYILHSSEEGGCHGHSHDEISLMHSHNHILTKGCANDSPKHFESKHKKKLTSCFQKKQFLEEFGISKSTKSVRLNINTEPEKRPQIEEVSSEDGRESITNKKTNLKQSAQSPLKKETVTEMNVITVEEKQSTGSDIKEKTTPVKRECGGHDHDHNHDHECGNDEYKMHQQCSHNHEKEIKLNYPNKNDIHAQQAYPSTTEKWEECSNKIVPRNLRMIKDSPVLKSYTKDFSSMEKVDYMKRQSENIAKKKPCMGESLSLKSPGLGRRNSKLHNLDVFLGFNKNCFTSSSSCNSSDDDSDHLERAIHFPEGAYSQDQSRIADTSTHMHEPVHVELPSPGKSQQNNINVQAAMIHIIGDIIQSIGVIIAAVLIYIFPHYQILDSITTVLFSIIVIFTTVPIAKQCIQVVMEGNVHGADLEMIKKIILQTPGVDSLNCMHLFSLSLEKPVLIVQVKATFFTMESELLEDLYNRLSNFTFYHCTIEITKEVEVQKRKCNNVLSL